MSPPPLRAEFDVVVIGAGHNGLICAAYLARAGLRVCVLEKRLEAGGGLTTEEVTRPGYYHNLHSVFHDAVEIMPAMTDLELAERHHVAYVRPPVQVGLALSDDRALCVHDEVAASVASIARISPDDARAYQAVHDRYREFVEAVVVPALYSSPPPPSHASAALEGSPEGMEWLRLGRSSPADVAAELFQSDPVRALALFQLAIPRGVVSDYAGLGMLVPLVVTQVERSHLCVGGSHALAHGLWRALLRAGGVVRGMHEALRIRVENGRAVGVDLRGGGTVHARAVVSAVGFRQTVLGLLGDAGLPEAVVRPARHFKLDEYSIFSVHLALEEPPRYRAARFAPELDRALKVGVGLDGPADFTRLWTDIRAGRAPEPAMYCAAPSLHDPTQAPPGRHTAFLWQPAPYRLGGDHARWDHERERYADRLLERWRAAAPNLGGGNIIARFIQTPLDIERKLSSMQEGGAFLGRASLDQLDCFRPAPAWSQARAPLPGLYLASGAAHPGGGILGAAGYIAAGAVAETLSVPRWWLGEGAPAR
ncbi:MAG: NAD(P)/FAD-dependent oxidoreductase [Deltaproteobacteria bacterium]|nr:NAD(P)/FAD-dependent oxidoreductase [Deltaproteobacteria bacterium]